MVCFKWKFPQTYNLYETRQNGQDRKRDSIHVQNRVQFLQEITFYNNYIPGIWYRRLKNSREGTPLSIPIRCDAQIKNHKRKQTAKKKNRHKKTYAERLPHVHWKVLMAVRISDLIEISPKDGSEVEDRDGHC
jgi:hypothetical protein